MDNFDLRKFLAEGKLHEAMSPQDVVDIADTVAEEFTKESAEEGDFLIYTVGRMEADDMSFELDTDVSAQTPKDLDTRGVGEGWGGIFRIKPSADGYEVRNAEKGGLVAMIDNSGNFRMLSADESRAEMGLEEGEEEVKEIKSNKMKKSELKEMIKSAMMAETSVSEAEEVEVEDDENVDVDVDIDADIDDEGGMDVEDDAKVELTGDKAEVSDNLEAALEAARALGDEKLVDQIGNTITFFTRAHIVKEGDEMDLEESAASNLELKNVAKQLYLGFKKMGADVELTKGKVVLNKKPADGNMDSKDVFIFVEDDRVVVDLVGDKAIGFIDPIKKDFSQFEFGDGGDGETWNNVKTKTLIITPGKTTSESLNESVVFPMWNKIK